MKARKAALIVTVTVAAAALGAFAPALAVNEQQPDARSQVVIRRDTFGIPHILGETEEAAAFGLGYAQAEDHAIEIARRLVAGRGEEAKYFGRSGVENDFMMAQFDNLEASRKDLLRISPLFRAIVRGYAAGVNLYLEQHRKELPSWIPPLTEADVLANIRARAVSSLASPGTRRALDAKYGVPRSDGMRGPGATGVETDD
ncbi:MAG: hypothetical protein EHM24_28325, partial [Acidobacteria bacterium]